MFSLPQTLYWERATFRSYSSGGRGADQPSLRLGWLLPLPLPLTLRILAFDSAVKEMLILCLLAFQDYTHSLFRCSKHM